MSRSGYDDDGYDNWEMIKWRGAVASAVRGRRGQAFLREMAAALDALPQRRLIRDELEAGGEVCALGAVGARRGIDQANIDPCDHERVAATFGIPRALAQEITYMNDEHASSRETPEERWARMRRWVGELTT